MKIWCEECKGTGKETIAYAKPHVRGIEHAYTFKCKACHGQGYTEQDVVAVSEVEMYLENGWIPELCEYIDLLKEAKCE